MHKKRIRALLILWSVAILTAAACQRTPDNVPTQTASALQNGTEAPPLEATVADVGATETDSSEPAAVTGDAYPPRLPTPTPHTGEYPPPAPTATPILSYPEPTQPTGTLLALTEPISAQDTEIAGVGPAGLRVFLLNITLGGEELGSATVADDGTFSIPVTSLEANSRIGLTAAPEQQGFDPAEVRPDAEARAVPTIGYFYDTALVTE